MSPLTADTITDEQIRELMTESRHLIKTDTGEAGTRAVLTFGVCQLALGLRRNRHGKNQRAVARARCAEILNARRAA
jgi:hypothetical protein